VFAGHIAGHGRISAALAVAGFGVAVAARRSYPASAGVAAGILMPLV